MSIRILLVDNQPFVRQGLAMFFATDGEFEIVGEVSNGLEAVDAASKLYPDVILMDLLMPVMDGVEATRIIRAAFPTMCIIALSSTTDYATICAAIEAGVNTYLFKGNKSEQLLSTVKGVFAGKVILAPAIRQRIVPLLTLPTDLSSQLTPEELQIIHLLVAQKSDEDIAQQIGRDLVSVQQSIDAMRQSFDAPTRLLFVLRAIQLGLAVE